MFPVGRRVRSRFRRVRFSVIGQFCVRNAEPSGWRMGNLAGKFPMKPRRADVRRILIAHTMRQESRVRDRHKILGGLAAGSAEGERIFPLRSLRFKSDVLEHNRVAHDKPPFLEENSRLRTQVSSQVDQEATKAQQLRHTHHGTLMCLSI